MSYGDRLDDVTKLFESLEGLEAAAASSGKPLEIPLEEIEEDPNQPRRAFDEAALAELATSIRERGVIQPIGVRPKGEGGKYRIVFGARRYRAALDAGLRTIPAIIRDPAQDVGYDQIVENIQRDNLRAPEIAAFITMRLQAGEKPSEIARRLGKDSAFVSMHAAVAQMPEALRAKLETSPIRAVYELFQLWKNHPDAVTAFVADKDTITRVEASGLARALNAPELGQGASRRGRPRAQVSAPNEGGARSVVEASKREDTRPAERSRPAETAVGPAESRAGRSLQLTVIVQHRRHRARLLLDRVAEQGTKFAAVALDGSDEVVEVPLSELRLIEVIPT